MAGLKTAQASAGSTSRPQRRFMLVASATTSLTEVEIAAATPYISLMVSGGVAPAAVESGSVTCVRCFREDGKPTRDGEQCGNAKKRGDQLRILDSPSPAQGEFRRWPAGFLTRLRRRRES